MAECVLSLIVAETVQRSTNQERQGYETGYRFVEQTPVKTRTPWPPGTFCNMVYIMRWRVQRSRVGCVQALAPAARDGLRESRCSCARVVAMRA